MSFDQIPATLRADHRWLVAKLETRDGRKTKVPYCAVDPNRKASSTDSSTWANFETARAVVEAGRAPMLGFSLHGSGFVGVDIDHCRDATSGVIAPWAANLIDALSTYAEASVSGTGVHLILRGVLPSGRRRTGQVGQCQPVPAGAELEMYDSGRYFVMTGEVVRDLPVTDGRDRLMLLHQRLFGTAPIETHASTVAPAARLTDEQVLERISASKQATKFDALWNGDTAAYKGDDSAADLALCMMLAFWTQKDRDQIDRLFRRSGLCRAKWDREDYRTATLDKACRIDRVYRPSALMLDAGDPLVSARKFVEHHHLVGVDRALQFQQGAFLAFDPQRSAYGALEESTVRAGLYTFLEDALAVDEQGEIGPFKPTKTKVESVVDALRAICHLPAAQAAPCWLVPDTRGLQPHEMIPCRNGLLHVPTRRIFPATPQFFGLNGIDLTYTPDAPPPSAWLAFLDTLWSNDADTVDALQEWFGYCLTPDTRFQKIAMIVGPKRSGKGTIARVLRQLVGRDNACAPTLASFGSPFGKQELIDKTLAIISDARISGRSDTAVVAETLLSISGEDAQTVARKYLPAWNGRLAVRFLVLTNELPRLTDAAGALASRFVILRMTESFFGREDLALTDKLTAELPGILRWALDGRDRLYARGHFRQPASARQLIDELNDLASPEHAFLEERCELRVPGAEVSQPDLYRAFCDWATINGHEHQPTAQTFGRNLRALLPWLNDHQHREHGVLKRFWIGVRLKPEADEPGQDDLLHGRDTQWGQ
jgi:putative DNA primase/helicase